MITELKNWKEKLIYLLRAWNNFLHDNIIELVSGKDAQNSKEDEKTRKERNYAFWM